MTDLGTLGGFNSWALGVRGGRVVGASDTGDGSFHAFLWKDGQMIDLGTLGGQNSIARDFANGVVVGERETATWETHAFQWTAAGGMTDLGTLGGAFSTANALNLAGEIVGSSSNTAGESRAVRWLVGTNTPIDLFAGKATDVNDGRQRSW